MINLLIHNLASPDDCAKSSGRAVVASSSTVIVCTFRVGHVDILSPRRLNIFSVAGGRKVIDPNCRKKKTKSRTNEEIKSVRPLLLIGSDRKLFLLRLRCEMSGRKKSFRQKEKRRNGKMNYSSAFASVGSCASARCSLASYLFKMKCVISFFKMKIRNFLSILWAVAFSVIRACLCESTLARAHTHTATAFVDDHQQSVDFDRGSAHCCRSSFVSVYTFLLYERNRTV